MAEVLNAAQISTLLRPYLAEALSPPADLYEQLATYLALLLKWNSRMNLTAIREPEEIVTRHFGESLFAAQYVPACETLLDVGSGAGFPGLPIQLWHPNLHVTLAESQNKKSSFLREVVRALGLRTETWAGRAELMPPERRFDVATFRAIDNMAKAVAVGGRLAGRLLVMTTEPVGVDGFEVVESVPMPGGVDRRVVSLQRVPENVPRGTF